MAIARYETIEINQLVSTTSKYKQQRITPSALFKTTAQVMDTTSDFKIVEDTRVYIDITKFKLRNTPSVRDIALNNEKYAITYRNKAWKIHDVLETNDRAWVIVSASSQSPEEAL